MSESRVEFYADLHNIIINGVRDRRFAIAWCVMVTGICSHFKKMYTCIMLIDCTWIEILYCISIHVCVSEEIV